MDTLRFLDILGFAVGLVYLYLEYKANIWLWLASIVMPAIDMVLYFEAGLYADFGMAVYYCLTSVYGVAIWKLGRKDDKHGAGDMPITHLKKSYYLPVTVCTLVIWLAIWWFLANYTNSTVPVSDAFTTALSIVALWALAHKYVEQWLLWFVVDAISFALYIHKGIPFKACIYGIYTAFAVFGYLKWLKMMKEQTARES